MHLNETFLGTTSMLKYTHKHNKARTDLTSILKLELGDEDKSIIHPVSTYWDRLVPCLLGITSQAEQCNKRGINPAQLDTSVLTKQLVLFDEW